MADMLSVVVTMHPRAALTIGTAWELADLPTFEVSEARIHVTPPAVITATEVERGIGVISDVLSRIQP